MFLLLLRLTRTLDFLTVEEAANFLGILINKTSETAFNRARMPARVRAKAMKDSSWMIWRTALIEEHTGINELVMSSSLSTATYK